MGSRVKNSIKNIMYGAFIQVFTVLLNYAARIVLVRILGKDVNGLNGLLTEVVTMLSLAEMGVGAAITYHLYKPLAIGDNDRVARLMWLYQTAYRVIAGVILAIGLVLTPFAHLIVNSDVDFSVSYIRLVFFLFIVKAATSYLFSYKTSLLIADQKNYVVSIITVITKALTVGAGIVVLLITGEYVPYLIVAIAFNFVTNICISLAADKRYPFLKQNKERLPREECKSILSNIRHLFVGKLSGKVTNSTDSILISLLVGTLPLGIYSNYALFVSNAKVLFAQVVNAMLGGLGNLFVTETPEYCDRVLRRLTFMFFVFGTVMGCGFAGASDPFMTISFGDGFLLDRFTLFFVSYNLFVFIFIEPLWSVMSVAGLFVDDKRASVAGTVINLIVSFILGKFIGIAGILIGTTCTLVIQLYIKSRALYKKKLALAFGRYAASSAQMLLLAAASIYACEFVCGMFTFDSHILDFIVKGCTGVAIAAAVVLLFYARSDEFAYFLHFAGTQIGKLKKKFAKNA